MPQVFLALFGSVTVTLVTVAKIPRSACATAVVTLFRFEKPNPAEEGKTIHDHRQEMLWRDRGPVPTRAAGGWRSLAQTGRIALWEEHMRRILFTIALLISGSGVVLGQSPSASEIAPGGKLRVGIIAIAVLGGVAEPVAGFIGQKLGATVKPVMYPSSRRLSSKFRQGRMGHRDWTARPRTLR